jgi:hypothetical protein
MSQSLKMVVELQINPNFSRTEAYEYIRRAVVRAVEEQHDAYRMFAMKREKVAVKRYYKPMYTILCKKRECLHCIAEDPDPSKWRCGLKRIRLQDFEDCTHEKAPGVVSCSKFIHG